MLCSRDIVTLKTSIPVDQEHEGSNVLTGSVKTVEQIQNTFFVNQGSNDYKE